MARALFMVLLLGCGSGSRDTGASTTGDEREADTDTRSNTDDEREADTDTRSDTDGEHRPTDLADADCAGRAPADCTAEGGCVRLPDDSCRAATHECELVQIDVIAIAPAFDRGDPCQLQNPACAWSTATGRCAPFVAVPSCPATAEEAAELSVFCDHSDQSALRCSYPGTECACRRTPYCGGAAPSPEQEYPPAHFSCIPDFADNGCPNRDPPTNARCDLDPSVQCLVGCYGLYTCENGRWNRRQLPPRP